MSKKIKPLNNTDSSSAPKMKIQDTKGHTSLGILLMNDEDIDLIRSRSGKLAEDNEYQVHYWYLNYRYTFEDSILDVAIPTVYFNYKQEVSSASVGFDLGVVGEYSEKLLPLHNLTINKQLVNQIPPDILEVTPTLLSVNLGTIHRHPGSLCAFSGTDLDAKYDNPGIVFPFDSVPDPDKPSFSSIIIHDNGNAKIGHSEYRIANQKDNTILYEKHECITYVKGETIQPSTVKRLIGAKPIDTSYLVTKVQDLSHLTSILDWFNSFSFTANTDFIKSEHVEKKTWPQYKAPNTSPTKKDSKTKKSQSIFEFANSKPASKIPDYKSAEFQVIANFLDSMYDIRLYPKERLEQMPKPLYHEYCMELEEHYYIEASGIRMDMDELLELQEDIWLEAKKEMEGLYTKHA